MLCRVIGSILQLRITGELSGWNLGGQEHTETRATAGPIRHPHPAAVRQNDRLADGQSESVAWHARLEGSLVAIERLEDTLATCSGDTRPLIVDGELQLA